MLSLTTQVTIMVWDMSSNQGATALTEIAMSRGKMEAALQMPPGGLAT